MLMTPGRAPPTLTHTRRTARPMVALARKPAPNTDAAQFTSSARRTGPLTMTSGVTASVVPETPTSAKSGSQIALTAAMTTGRYSGRQPAITAFTAMRSTVARPWAGATRPISSSPRRPLAEATAALARGLGIKLLSRDDVETIDVAVDGADEIDPRADLIKGYGGALLREKVVATMARRFVVLAGAEKLVPVLGTRGRLPVEVVPFAAAPCRRRVEALGYPPTLRASEGRPVVTDNGNLLLDCRVGPIADPPGLEAALRAIPGLVGTGLFLGMHPTVLVWDGARLRTLPPEVLN